MIIRRGKIQYIIKFILIAIGIILSLNAIALLFLVNYNFGTVITLALGLVFLVCGIWFHEINQKTRTGAFKWIKYIVVTGMTLYTCLIVFIAIYGYSDNAVYDEEAVVVLGAGIRGETVSPLLANRLDEAAEYYNKNSNTVIVVSGGQGMQESITEALAMERYLINKGVDKDKIVKEERATSTYENFVYSKAILDDMFDESYKIVLVTNHFHIYRAGQIAKIAGLESTHIHAGTVWYTLPVNYIRESLAVIKMWLIKR